MDKEFFIRLLAVNPRVTIPDFGTFLRKSQENQTVFTPFLKSDDGFLSGELSREYDISSQDASEMIVGFVGSINEVLDSSGRYFFEGIGSIVRDSNGALSFVMDTSRQISAPTFVEDSFSSVESIIEGNVEVKKEAEKEVAKEADVMEKTQTPKSPEPKVAFGGNSSPGVTPRPIVGEQFTQRVSPQPQRPVSPLSQPQSPLKQGLGNNAPLQQQSITPPKPQRQSALHPQGGLPAQQQPMAGRYQGQHPGYISSSKPKKSKGDLWLIIAIVAAILVIGYMVFAIFFTDNSGSMFQSDSSMVDQALDFSSVE